MATHRALRLHAQEEEEPHADRSVSKEGHLSGWVVYSTNRKAIVTCGPRTFGRAPNMADIEAPLQLVS